MQGILSGGLTSYYHIKAVPDFIFTKTPRTAVEGAPELHQAVYVYEETDMLELKSGGWLPQARSSHLPMHMHKAWGATLFSHCTDNKINLKRFMSH